MESFDMVRPGYDMSIIKNILKQIGFDICRSNYTNRFLGRLVWELEQKANKYRLMTKLIFPFLSICSRLDSLIGGKGNGFSLICKKNEK